MQQADFDNFARVLDAAYALHSKALTADARSLFFAALAEFSIADVRKAFSAHLRDPQAGRFPPKPADLIGHLRGASADDGRPGAEEAWAIAVTSTDERATVVWTQDMAEAFAIAQPVLAMGDDVGARMAFKESYSRIVAQRRAQGVAPSWSAALGWDSAGREKALVDAVRLNRLPLAKVRHMLPNPEVTLSLEFDDHASAEVSEEGLARVKEILSALPTQAELQERASNERVAAEKSHMAFLKKAAAQRVAEYQGNRA